MLLDVRRKNGVLKNPNISKTHKDYFRITFCSDLNGLLKVIGLQKHIEQIEIGIMFQLLIINFQHK